DPRSARQRRGSGGCDRAVARGSRAAPPHGGSGDSLGPGVHVGAMLPGVQECDGTGRGVERRMTTESKSGLFRRLKVPLVVLKILLSVALFAYVIAKVSPRNVWTTMSAADPGLITLAGAVFLLSGLIGSWLWGRLLRAQGVPIPYSKAASYYFVGLFFNNFLPSNVGGDIARISDAAKHASHVSPVFSATLMERLIGVVAIGFLAVVASIAAFNHLHPYAIYGMILALFLVSV